MTGPLTVFLVGSHVYVGVRNDIFGSCYDREGLHTRGLLRRGPGTNQNVINVCRVIPLMPGAARAAVSSYSWIREPETYNNLSIICPGTS